MRRPSASEQFSAQLTALTASVRGGGVAFVRCVKPSAEAVPWRLDDGYTLRQLRCTGMLQAVRIRAAGYAHREPHARFWRRCAPLLGGGGGGGDGGGDGSGAATPSREVCAELLLELCARLGLAPEQGQCGSSKVFLRAELGATLEALCRLRRRAASRALQRAARRRAASARADARAVATASAVQAVQAAWRGAGARRTAARRRRAARALCAATRRLLASLATRECTARRRVALRVGWAALARAAAAGALCAAARRRRAEILSPFRDDAPRASASGGRARGAALEPEPAKTPEAQAEVVRASKRAAQGASPPLQAPGLQAPGLQVPQLRRSPQSCSTRVPAAGVAGIAGGTACGTACGTAGGRTASVATLESERLGAAPAAAHDAVASEPPSGLASTAAAAAAEAVAFPVATPRNEEGAATERHSYLSVTRAVDVCGWLVAASSLVVGAGLLRQLLVARSR